MQLQKYSYISEKLQFSVKIAAPFVKKTAKVVLCY